MCPNQDDEKQLEDQDCTNCSNMARAIFSQMWKNLTMKGIKVSQSNMNYAKDGWFPVVRATCCVGGLDMLQLHIMLCYLNRATRRSLWDQSVDSKLGLTMLIKGDVSKAVVIISHYKPLLPTQSILSHYNTTHSYSFYIMKFSLVAVASLALAGMASAAPSINCSKTVTGM